MKVRNLALDDEGDPTTINVDLTLAEVCLLVRMLGRQNDVERNEIMIGGGAIGSQIYDGLDQLLLRFYEEGVNDAVRSL